MTTLVDTNVLLYATDRSSPWHDRSHAWLTRVLRDETAAFTWLAITAFVRVSTNPRVVTSPLDSDTAIDTVEAWLSSPGAVVLEPSSRHLSVMRRLLHSTGSAGNLTSDAHLAAIALERGAPICTYDRDFGRFEGVVHFEPPG